LRSHARAAAHASMLTSAEAATQHMCRCTLTSICDAHNKGHPVAAPCLACCGCAWSLGLVTPAIKAHICKLGAACSMSAVQAAATAQVASAGVLTLHVFLRHAQRLFGTCTSDIVLSTCAGRHYQHERIHHQQLADYGRHAVLGLATLLLQSMSKSPAAPALAAAAAPPAVSGSPCSSPC
jgi:hypothetical protein